MKFASCISLYMGWNKLRSSGMKISTRSSMVMVSISVNLIKLLEQRSCYLPFCRWYTYHWHWSSYNHSKSSYQLSSTKFNMQDLRNAGIILGIKILHSEKGIAFRERNWSVSVLLHWGYANKICVLWSSRAIGDFNKKYRANTTRRWVKQLEYST